MSTTTPLVLWAQRSSEDEPSKNIIYLTIEASDRFDVQLDLTSTNLKFSAKSLDGNVKYHLDLEFFDEIDPENSHKNTESGNHIYLVLRKKNLKAEYWPRLTKEKLKLHYVKTDFDKWVDEDEQDEQPEEEDLSNMMNMGGAPGGPGAGGPGLGGLGAGGPGGMDFSKLMESMGGAGGAGGAGGFDVSQLASQLGQAGGNLEGDEADEDAEEEEATDAKAE